MTSTSRRSSFRSFLAEQRERSALFVDANFPRYTPVYSRQIQVQVLGASEMTGSVICAVWWEPRRGEKREGKGSVSPLFISIYTDRHRSIAPDFFVLFAPVSPSSRSSSSSDTEALSNSQLVVVSYRARISLQKLDPALRCAKSESSKFKGRTVVTCKFFQLE